MASTKSKASRKGKARKEDPSEGPKRRVKDLPPKSAGDVKGGYLKVKQEDVIIST